MINKYSTKTTFCHWDVQDYHLLAQLSHNVRFSIQIAPEERFLPLFKQQAAWHFALREHLVLNVLNNKWKEPLFSFYMAVVIHSDGPITCRGIFSAPTAQPWMPMLAWRAFDLPSEVNTKWQDFCLHSLDTFLPSRGLSTHRHGRMTTTKPAKNTSSLVASKSIERSKII